MKITGVVAVLHDAVADFSLQLGISVERGNEAADFPMPFLRRAVGELVFDHEMLHRGPPAAGLNLALTGTLLQVWTKMILWTRLPLIISLRRATGDDAM